MTDQTDVDQSTAPEAATSEVAKPKAATPEAAAPEADAAGADASEDAPKVSFADLDLDRKVLKAVTEAGYENPTPIQADAIPHALKGRDVLGIAQTGTGKTASFTLPMISILGRGRARARMPRSLILCPTRELAAQVAENFEIYGKYHRLTMALLIGGVSFKDQDKKIDRGVDVLIATPGRLLDHFERGKLMMTGIEIMVVDEADRMLDMGFIPDIERIFKLTPFTRQTLFFSATMPPEITKLTNEFLSNPVRIEVARQATTSANIAQKICKFSPSKREKSDAEKRDLLRALLIGEGDGFKNAIVFCNRKRDVGVVAKSLVKHGFNAAAIHGDLEQSERMRVLDGFRDGSIAIMVASDVAARGLDIPAVSHVFNYDVPIHSEDYVHRIGRTGRAGLKGTAITICHHADGKYLEKIESLIEQSIPVIPTPEGFASTRSAEEAPSEERPRRASRSSRAAPKSESDEATPGEDAAEAPAPKPRASRSRTRKAAPATDAPAPEAIAPEATAEPAAPEPAAETAEAPSEPKRREPRRASRARDGQRDRAERPESGGDRGDRNSRGGRGRSGRGGAPVVGLGDHVPAFLMTPVYPERMARGSTKTEEPASSDDKDGEADAAA